MAAETNIEWCDATFNPWIGCTRVSPACDDCYAARSTPVRTRGIEWGPGAARQRTSEANWKLPIRWNNSEFMQCANCKWRGDQNEWRGLHASRCCAQPMLDPARRRVFCASLADWLDNEAPIEWLVELLNLIRRTPNLDWLLLTKRIGNWRSRLKYAAEYCQGHDELDEVDRFIGEWIGGASVPTNVWIGATVVTQDELRRDIEKLMKVKARVRFLSIEPMLGPMSLRWLAAWPENAPTTATNPERGGRTNEYDGLRKLSWIIAGGESGSKARPMHPDWIRTLRDQCAEAGVPFLFKQHGEFREWDTGDNKTHVVDADDLPVSAQDALAKAVNPCFIAADGRVFSSVDDIPYDLKARLMERVGKKAAGNTLDGRQHLEWPAHG